MFDVKNQRKASIYRVSTQTITLPIWAQVRLVLSNCLIWKCTRLCFTVIFLLQQCIIDWPRWPVARSIDMSSFILSCCKDKLAAGDHDFRRQPLDSRQRTVVVSVVSGSILPSRIFLYEGDCLWCHCDRVIMLETADIAEFKQDSYDIMFVKRLREYVGSLKWDLHPVDHKKYPFLEVASLLFPCSSPPWRDDDADSAWWNAACLQDLPDKRQAIILDFFKMGCGCGLWGCCKTCLSLISKIGTSIMGATSSEKKTCVLQHRTIMTQSALSISILFKTLKVMLKGGNIYVKKWDREKEKAYVPQASLSLYQIASNAPYLKFASYYMPFLRYLGYWYT